MSIEESAVWQALQDVDDGQDPADVYQRLIGESVDPEEAIENEYHDAIESDHPHEPCRHKHQQIGHCMGNECVSDGPNIRIMLQCPCSCHEGEEW